MHREAEEMAKKLGRTEFGLTANIKSQIDRFFQRKPQAFFKMPFFRDLVTMDRLRSVSVDEMEVADKVDPGAIKNALEYNKEMLRNIESHKQTLHRPQLLIDALTSIYYIVKNKGVLKVLCVGPRTEAEFLMLLAEDFNPDNIQGLDLISYSDYVDVGDMHHMPYDDDSFDIVFLGWVLTYSKDLQRVADECVRVAKPGGYIAVGVESPAARDNKEAYGVTMDDVIVIKSTDEILELFKDHIHAVPFRHDVHRSLRETLDMVMVVIELI